MANEGIQLPASAATFSNRQKLFVRYFTGILIDLVVLNVFAEYSKHVTVESFTVSLFAAVLLQVLLKLTMALEHRIAAYFNAKQGGFARFMRFFSAWLVLFGSKFVILEAINLAFGGAIAFTGPIHGLVVVIAVLVTMVLAEEMIARLYRRPA
jgi:hypothetical protein